MMRLPGREVFYDFPTDGSGEWREIPPDPLHVIVGDPPVLSTDDAGATYMTIAVDPTLDVGYGLWAMMGLRLAPTSVDLSQGMTFRIVWRPFPGTRRSPQVSLMPWTQRPGPVSFPYQFVNYTPESSADEWRFMDLALDPLIPADDLAQLAADLASGNLMLSVIFRYWEPDASPVSRMDVSTIQVFASQVLGVRQGPLTVNFL